MVFGGGHRRLGTAPFLFDGTIQPEFIQNQNKKGKVSMSNRSQISAVLLMAGILALLSAALCYSVQ